MPGAEQPKGPQQPQPVPQAGLEQPAQPGYCHRSAEPMGAGVPGTEGGGSRELPDRASREFMAALEGIFTKHAFRMIESVRRDTEELVLAWAPRRQAPEMERMLLGIDRKLDALGHGIHQVTTENEQLKRLQAEGYFQFVTHVDKLDFLAFAFIMALGNRNAAAARLGASRATFYDRIEKWQTKGKHYQRMYRWVEWRKAVGRRITVPLDDSLQSGEPSSGPENPETIGAVLTRLVEADGDSPQDLLRELLEALERQNGSNWDSVRTELVGLIKEELPP